MKLKNTNTKAFRETVFTYIVDACYDFEGDEAETATDLLGRFKAEYDYPANRKRYPNNQDRICSWLQGLPINIDYTNHDIIERAKQWHEVSELTDKQTETIIDNWFNFLAFKLIQLWAKHGLSV